ncbi:MAG: NTP transferase domain-containing protein [Bacteroidota bacterium]
MDKVTNKAISQSHVLGILPARMTSRRLQHKLLIKLDGISIIRRTTLQALQCAQLHQVVVASDHQQILDEVADLPCQRLLIRDDVLNGTERCAIASKHFSDISHVVNIQAEQPYIEPNIIDRLAMVMASEDDKCIYTLCRDMPCNDVSTEVVKVTTDQNKYARSFTRELPDSALSYEHIGVYGYSAPLLQTLAHLSPTPSEQEQKLEQLRWMDHDYPIHVIVVSTRSISIDSNSDLHRAQLKTRAGI